MLRLYYGACLCDCHLDLCLRSHGLRVQSRDSPQGAGAEGAHQWVLFGDSRRLGQKWFAREICVDSHLMQLDRVRGDTEHPELSSFVTRPFKSAGGCTPKVQNVHTGLSDFFGSEPAEGSRGVVLGFRFFASEPVPG